jgi:hypothetical protein
MLIFKFPRQSSDLICRAGIQYHKILQFSDIFFCSESCRALESAARLCQTGRKQELNVCKIFQKLLLFLYISCAAREPQTSCFPLA